jgi:hypothetical protein
MNWTTRAIPYTGVQKAKTEFRIHISKTNNQSQENKLKYFAPAIDWDVSRNMPLTFELAYVKLPGISIMNAIIPTLLLTTLAAING